jgi:hypothetical protein
MILNFSLFLSLADSRADARVYGSAGNSPPLPPTSLIQILQILTLRYLRESSGRREKDTFSQGQIVQHIGIISDFYM